MSTTHVLVKFDTNWADEMDLQGFKVFSKEEWQTFQNSFPEGMFPLEVWFGTNESNPYETKEDFLAEYSVTEIEVGEALVLNKLFGGEYGHFPTLEYEIKEYLEESNMETGDYE